MYLNAKPSPLYANCTTRLFALRLGLSRWSALLANLFGTNTPINWTLEITTILCFGIFALWFLAAVPVLVDRLSALLLAGQLSGDGRSSWIQYFSRLW